MTVAELVSGSETSCSSNNTLDSVVCPYFERFYLQSELWSCILEADEVSEHDWYSINHRHVVQVAIVQVAENERRAQWLK